MEIKNVLSGSAAFAVLKQWAGANYLSAEGSRRKPEVKEYNCLYLNFYLFSYSLFILLVFVLSFTFQIAFLKTKNNYNKYENIHRNASTVYRLGSNKNIIK